MVLARTFRGFFRAVAMHLQGDERVEEEGFLSLNPVAHIDAIGIVLSFLLITALTIFSFPLIAGMMSTFIFMIYIVGLRNEVPLEPRRLIENEKGAAKVVLTSFAGNLVLVLLLMYLAKISTHLGFISAAMQNSIKIVSVISIDGVLRLALFFLLPVPSLDGMYLLHYINPNVARMIEDFEEKYGFIGFFLILMILDAPITILKALIIKFLYFLVFI